MWNIPTIRFVPRRALLLSAFLLSTITTFVSYPPHSAHAQNRNGLVDRIDRLERDIQLIQRDYYTGKTDGKPSGGGATSAASANAAVAGLEEEIRRLNGRLEEMEHANRRLAEKFDSLERDIDARMMALESAAPVAAPVMAPVINSAETPAEAKPEPVAEEAPKPTPSPKASAVSNYQNSSEHYNAAFKLLNQGDYDESAAQFESFTKAYPDDVLIGNAYYWLGETYYVRSKHAEAAEKFRSGFEAMPDGPKAPDNLLKLSMSLSAIKRNDEACVVLSQLIKKYGDSSQVVKRKAELESDKLSCD